VSSSSSARRTVLAGAAALVAAAPVAAEAAAPKVPAMIVDSKQRVVAGPRTVTAAATYVRSSGRRCRVPQGVALGVLAALRRAGGPAFASRGPCDSPYVHRIGREAERGTGGWVYKVGRRLGTTSAADPTGPFGTGRRLRSGQRVVWFWCARAGRCARTLEVRPAQRTVAPGAPLRVTVRSFDDNGRGRAVAGATVRLAGASTTTAADGSATLASPAVAGRHRLTATAPRLVPAYPEAVTVR
jgi:hypothetical protein